MSFIELVQEVARKSGFPRATVLKVLKAFMESTKKTLESGESVKLTGFGAFHAKRPPAGPLFGGARMSGGRRIVRFVESRRRSHGKVRRADRQ